MTRAAMWALLAVVASAAAVLSFAALRDLAQLCGFATSLAWLLPLVIDAGAAAGCLVWLRVEVESPARNFARSLTIVLLASSVAGNAVVHGLSAYRLAAPWWLVVAVSAVAPAVLGAVVHLAVLVSASPSGRPQRAEETTNPPAEGEDTPGVDVTSELIESGIGRRRLAAELGVTEASGAAAARRPEWGGAMTADQRNRDDAPTVAEIAALTARLRVLSTPGQRPDPDEVAAFLADKEELLARIEEAGR